MAHVITGHMKNSPDIDFDSLFMVTHSQLLQVGEFSFPHPPDCITDCLFRIWFRYMLSEK